MEAHEYITKSNFQGIFSEFRPIWDDYSHGYSRSIGVAKTLEKFHRYSDPMGW